MRSEMDRSGDSRSQRLLLQGQAVLSAAEASTLGHESSPTCPASDLSSLDGRLAVVGGVLRDRLRAADSGSDWQELAVVSSTLADLHSVRYEINEHLLQERSRRIDAVEEGLVRLRRIHDPDDLIARACVAVVEHCGFDRALLSKVDGSLWRPWRAHSSTYERPERSFRAWMDTEPEIRLEHLFVESDVIRRRESARVTPDDQGHGVSADFARERGLTSYVVAPLLPGDDVIGLLHADHLDRDVTDLDLHVLTAFARSFDSIFERSVLLQRLDSQRDRVRSTVRSVETMLDELATAEIAFASSALGSMRPLVRPSPSSPATEFESVLTKREIEVLALMAAGGTNARIADKLVITPDTVKSHVGRILRKLRVDNRAEAVSKYLRSTLGQQE